VIVVALSGVDGRSNVSVDDIFGSSPSPHPPVRVQPLFGDGPRPAIAATVLPNGTATFHGTFSAGVAEVFQLGCEVATPALPSGELCRNNCDFEHTDAWRPMIIGSSAVGAPLHCTSAAAGVKVPAPCDENATWLRSDPSDPFQGRYALRLNVAPATQVLLPVAATASTASDQKLRVQLAARSSPAGATFSVIYEDGGGAPQPPIVLGSEWSMVDVAVSTSTVANGKVGAAPPLRLVVTSVGAASVWIDAVSVLAAPEDRR